MSKACMCPDCQQMRAECESCQILIKKHGIEKLEICEFCNHYYYEKCTCTEAQQSSMSEVRERNKKLHAPHRF